MRFNARAAFQADPITIMVYSLFLRRTWDSNPQPRFLRATCFQDRLFIQPDALHFAEEVRLELTRVLPPTVFKTATHRPTWLILPYFEEDRVIETRTVARTPGVQTQFATLAVPSML